MKKSRLKLFKSTSMVVSILGILMIIATIIVAAYVGFDMISGSLSGGISSSNQYDALNALKANYSDLEGQFNTTKVAVYASDKDILQQKYAEAELELVRARNSLDEVQSALSTGKSSQDVDERLKKANNDLANAYEVYDNFKNEFF